jgi:hypothetical protein
VLRSSWARCSRKLHVHVWLLARRDGEADLRCVVSSYSARGYAERTYNSHKVRFAAAPGEEPTIELGLA